MCTLDQTDDRDQGKSVNSSTDRTHRTKAETNVNSTITISTTSSRPSNDPYRKKLDFMEDFKAISTSAWGATSKEKEDWPSKHPTLNFNDSRIQESSMCNFILPCFKFLHWVQYCPDSFAYSETNEAFSSNSNHNNFDSSSDSRGSRSICYVKGSYVRKMLSFFLQIIVIIHIWGTSLVDQHKAGINNIVMMHKVIRLTYIAFYMGTMKILLLNCESIGKIFVCLQQLETEFHSKGCNFPNPSKAKIISWTIIGICVTVSVVFTCVMRFKIGIWLDDGFYAFLSHMGSTAILECRLLFDLDAGFEFNPTTVTQRSVSSNAGVVLPFALLGFLYDFSWVFGFLINFVWGVVLSWIFKLFFEHLTTIETTADTTLIAIRKFNQITFIIDSFNRVFSLNIFTAVLCGSLHFSVYVLTLFTNEQRGLLPIVTALSFSMFWLQLFASAHVNHSAQAIGTVLKTRFQTITAPAPALVTTTFGRRVINSDEISVETVQGMVLIFYGLLAGKVGFQGLGFFTVTYSFIGTVLSVIATYSLVVMQMDNRH